MLDKGPAELYKNPLKISSTKYRNLNTLCSNKIRPERFHSKFLNLHAHAIEDLLPETYQEHNSLQILKIHSYT